MSRLFSLSLVFFACSCNKHILYSKWRVFEVNDLNATISILRNCPVADCYVAVRSQSGILFEDSKRRHPWFSVGLISKDAYGVIICDQTSDELFLLWKTTTHSLLSKKESDEMLKLAINRIGFKSATSSAASVLICDVSSSESGALRSRLTTKADSGGVLKM